MIPQLDSAVSMKPEIPSKYTLQTFNRFENSFCLEPPGLSRGQIFSKIPVRPAVGLRPGRSEDGLIQIENKFYFWIKILKLALSIISES